MNSAAVTRDAVAIRASYFYLSYAHSPPLAGNPELAHDQWVRALFDDLAEVVRRMGKPRRGIAAGFFDQKIPLGSDWRASLARGLSSAEVFVPLYSPGYFARSWPGREWAYFQRSLLEVGVENPMMRVTPVLWSPLQPGFRPAGLDEALAIGAGESAYAENGLRALLRLAPYRSSYSRVVERLASRIVDLAENAPIPVSAVRDIGDLPSPFVDSAAAEFAVAVAAPTRAAMPAGADAAAYSTSSIGWRPFPAVQELSLAEYAATVAEQLDFAVLVMDLRAVEGQLGTRPGVILIDPSFGADEEGLDALRRAVSGRPWILPVLVLVRPAGDDSRNIALAQRIRAILSKAQPAHTESVRLAQAGVGSLEQFVALMPFLIAEAERQYLRRGPIMRATARPGLRPRLRPEEDSDD
jgi:FxsC-like protein